MDASLLRTRYETALAALETASDGRYPVPRIIAVTKTHPAEDILPLTELNLTEIGENRVQELTAKLADHAYEGADLHFIGHLQTNKVKQVVGHVDLIQSVDSERLLRAIDTEAAKQGIRQNILLEVNIGGEESKSGFANYLT